MVNTRKRIVALCLSAALALCLSACGNQPKQELKPLEMDALPYYEMTFTALDMDGEMEQAIQWGGRLLCLTSQLETVTGEDGFSYEDRFYHLYSAALDGADIRELPIPEPQVETELPIDEVTLQYYICSLCALPDGRAALLMEVVAWYLDLPDGVAWDKVTTMDYWKEKDWNVVAILDGEGRLLETIQLEFPEDFRVQQDFQLDGQGNWYFIGYDQERNALMAILDPDGRLRGTIPIPSWFNGFAPMPSGGMAAVVWTNNGTYKLHTIDADKLTLSGDSIAIPYSNCQVVQGSGDYDLFCNTGVSLMGHRPDSDTWELMLTWINQDLDGNALLGLRADEGGKVFRCISSTGSGDLKVSSLVTLKRSEGGRPQDRKTLTLACNGLQSSVAAQVVTFNQTNPEYRVEIRDYSAYNTGGNVVGGLEQLTVEIIAGKIPDMFCTDEMPVQTYMNRGLLEDLWPYIDADQEIGGRENLVQPLFEAMSSGDALYEIGPTFLLYTAVAPSSLVGEESGWTLEEFHQLRSTLDGDSCLFSPWHYQGVAMNGGMAVIQDQLVDWEKGECYFDTETFTSLLEFAGCFPAEYPENTPEEAELILQGRLPVVDVAVFSVDQFQRYETLYGEPITVLGYPSPEGNGSAFEIRDGLAMSSACRYKEGAWAFMRTILTQQYQTAAQSGIGVFGLPTNRLVLDSLLESAMEPDLVGSQERPKGYAYYPNGEPQMPYYTMTEEQRDFFLRTLEETSGMRYYDPNIWEIVDEEIQAFFAGQMTAQEVGKRIQSRAELYMNEQLG